jgi:hypothetical protein
MVLAVDRTFVGKGGSNVCATPAKLDETGRIL